MLWRLRGAVCVHVAGGAEWLTRRHRAGSLYWWAGRDAAYIIGGVGMAVVTAVAWRGLADPAAGGEEKKKKKM